MRSPPTEHHVEISLEPSPALDGCDRKDAPRSKTCRIISIQRSAVREPEKSLDRLEPHRSPPDAAAGYRRAEHAPERIEEVDLRGRVDGHRAITVNPSAEVYLLDPF